jgi:hypothetical protein
LVEAYPTKEIGMDGFTGCKVFTATKHNERRALGEEVTAWIKGDGKECQIVDKIVTQSSDSEFHCIAITLFYNGEAQHSVQPRR